MSIQRRAGIARNGQFHIEVAVSADQLIDQRGLAGIRRADDIDILAAAVSIQGLYQFIEAPASLRADRDDIDGFETLLLSLFLHPVLHAVPIQGVPAANPAC